MSYRQPTQRDADRYDNQDEFVTYDDYYDDVRNYYKEHEPSKARRIIGKIILYLQAAVSIVFIVLLFRMNFLPDKVTILLVIILVILWWIIFISQRRMMKKLQALGMILSILASIILAFGAFYLAKTDSVIQTVTTRSYDIRTYDVAVRADDAAQALADTRNYTFAVQSNFRPQDLESIVNDVQESIGGEIKTVEMSSSAQQVESLMSGEVNAIIYNDAFTSTILEQFESFETDTRILQSFTVKTVSNVQPVDVDVEDNSFLVFISGNDSEGEVSLTGRSDTNIVVGLNPDSKQILLLTIPRDYYVEFPGITAQGARDKLTHAGIYGMDELLAAAGNLLGRNINYYLRLNFSSMMEIVDAIGGVNVYNEFEFVSHGGYLFPAGNIDLDGEHALHYVRERLAFEDGDFARGRNQIKVINAMMDKLMSVNTITNYTAIADAVSRFAATNIPSNDITDLIKVQLSENPQWHVVSYQLMGEVMMQPCQSANGAFLSVDMPYRESVDHAKKLLDQLFNGEVLSEEEVPSAEKMTYVTDPV